MLKKSIALWSLLLLFPVALSGCFLEENKQETNDLRVYWQVQGGTCSTADISNVQIDIYDEAENLFDTTLTLCSNTESLFRSVPVGVYSVRATGLNGDSLATYESALIQVTVDAGDQIVELLPPLELGLKRATLEVSWVFESGKLCQFEGVDDIEISIWDQIEIQVLETKTVSCDYDPTVQPLLPDGTTPMGLVFDDLAPREVRIEAFGLNEKGLRVASASAGPMDLEPAKIHEVELELFPCTGENTSNCF